MVKRIQIQSLWETFHLSSYKIVKIYMSKETFNEVVDIHQCTFFDL